MSPAIVSRPIDYEQGTPAMSTISSPHKVRGQRSEVDSQQPVVQIHLDGLLLCSCTSMLGSPKTASSWPSWGNRLGLRIK